MIRREVGWLLLALAGLSGCSGWYSHAGLLEQPQPLEREIRVCAASVCRQSTMAADCDSCALHYAVRDVDSVKVRESNPVATAFLVGVLAAIAVVIARFIESVEDWSET